MVKNSSASNNAVGLKSSTGSNFGTYTNNVLTDNNIMNVNTPGTNCGTPQAVNCGDDSGAFGVLINRNDNDFSGNTVSGSNAFSYDFTRDGSAFEIYNGNRNKIHDNISLQKTPSPRSDGQRRVLPTAIPTATTWRGRIAGRTVHRPRA